MPAAVPEASPLPTATSTYAAAAARVEHQLERLRAALVDHAARQATRPDDWGFAGDLERLADALEDRVAALRPPADRRLRAFGPDGREVRVSVPR